MHTILQQLQQLGRITLIAVIFVVSLMSHMQPIYAGGGLLRRLSFPGGTATYCGTWQVEGDLGTSAEVSYQITDGNGTVLAERTFPNFHGDGILFSGSFTVQPKKNPITFRLSVLPSVSADIPCISASNINPIPAFAQQIKGTIVYSSEGQFYQISPSGTGRIPLLNREQLKDSEEFPVWSPDGKKLAFLATAGTEDQLYIADATGKNLRQLTSSHAHKDAVVWSPDSKHLAFAQVQFSTRTPNGIFVIYTVDVNGQNLRRLTSNDVNEISPAWSPDGKHLVFWSDFNKQPGIYVIDANGKNQQLIPGTQRPNFSGPVWAPDGQSILFAGTANNHLHIYSVNIDGSQRHALTDGDLDDIQPIWSPDGKHIAFARGHVLREGSDVTLYVMQPDGSQQVAVSDRKIANGIGIGGIHFSWSPDSKHLVFAAFVPESYEKWTVIVASLDNSPAYDIIGPDPRAFTPAWQPYK